MAKFIMANAKKPHLNKDAIISSSDESDQERSCNSPMIVDTSSSETLEMITANLTDFEDLCKPNFSGPKSGKFVVIDSVFYARLEKKNLSADSLDVILMDKKRQIVKMILYHELARQYAVHDNGTALHLNNLTIKKDDYVKYFGSPFNVTVNISKTDQIAIDEDLTEQWKDYLKILLFEQMSAAEFKQFNGFVCCLKVKKTVFPHQCTIKGSKGFVGSVFFETNDDPPKNVQMAFFNEHVFTMPALVVNTDYVIKHSHIKEKQLGKPVYSDFDIAATEKVEFECTQNASNTIPTMTLAELKSVDSLPNLIYSEIVFLSKPSDKLSAFNHHIFSAHAGDASEEDGKILTVCLELLAQTEDKEWQIGFALKGIFEVLLIDQMVTLRTIEKFVDKGSLHVPKAEYKKKLYLYRF
ncbi:hypothetical protein L596_019826 [Steinernema carpocapsae]|uniref:Uncharacterized protein n=1 Tax=Steinernema carpocapsae TaxID=34508 RepID=A0A4U5MRP7_STECR|nr:hypothetical protein L596_019826 [Steinernema carpocapsae]